MPGFVFWLTQKVKRKALWVVVLSLVLLLTLSAAVVLSPRVKPAAQVLPLAGRVIAVDPGHGGYDPGGEGEGVLEKDVTLEISLWLRDMLVEAGARVILTREQDQDLLVVPTGPKKKQDLENRLKIITEAQAEVVVSIHANSIASPRWYGAQTFYQNECEDSRNLAVLIQEEIIRVLKNTDRKAGLGKGNYFMLENSPVPAAIVEVGFLSNPLERGLLTEPTYQKKMAWCIYVGLIRYFH